MRQTDINAIAEIIGVTPESIFEIEPVVNMDAYEVRSRESALVHTVSGLDVVNHQLRAS
jgi:hypothetical protein